MTPTGISRGLSKAPPGLCLAQRCAALYDSSYGNKKIPHPEMRNFFMTRTGIEPMLQP